MAVMTSGEKALWSAYRRFNSQISLSVFCYPLHLYRYSHLPGLFSVLILQSKWPYNPGSL